MATLEELIAERNARRIVRDGPVPVARRSVHRHSMDCYHRGDVQRTEVCEQCGGNVKIKVLSCDLFGECTIGKQLPGIKCCNNCLHKGPYTRDASLCTHGQSFAPITTRHLICHLYPKKNSAWMSTVDMLNKHWALFNGQRIVAIATDSYTEQDKVRDHLNGCEFIEVENRPELREVVSMVKMLERIESLRHSEAVMFCHSKGVTRGPDAIVHKWRDVMFDTLCDWERVSPMLERFPVVGTFKKVGKGFSDSTSDWHFSGSFFWARCNELFRRRWKIIDQIKFGVEPYPSLHFAPHEAGALIHEGAVSEMNLYDNGYWSRVIDPLL